MLLRLPDDIFLSCGYKGAAPPGAVAGRASIRIAAAEPGGYLTGEYLQVVCFYLASARVEKRLFGTICEEALTAAFKYISLRSGLKSMITYSLLSPCVEVAEKLDDAELEGVGY